MEHFTQREYPFIGNYSLERMPSMQYNLFLFIRLFYDYSCNKYIYIYIYKYIFEFRGIIDEIEDQ